MSQRPRVLIELGVELDRAAREAGRHRRRRVRGPWVPSLSGVVTLLAGVCALAVAGFAIIAVDHRRPPTTATGRGSPQVAHRAPSDLRAWFAALRRPPTALDRLPSQVVDSIAGHPLGLGLNARSSRRVISTHDLQVWLVLSRRGLCEVDVQSGPDIPARSGFGAGCINIAGADKYGLVSTGKTFQTLLPDATSKVKITFKDGSSTLLTPNRNGVILYTPRKIMRRYSFTSPTGAKENQKVVISPHPPHD